MHCPACGSSDTQVTDTRVAEDGQEIRRRRRCLACDRRFKTVERLELSLPTVVKRDGSRRDFETGKLRASMQLALRKRPVPAERVDRAVRQIEERLASSGDREVSTEAVGRLVMEALRDIDEVAYIRFASVYKSFKDASEFGALLNELERPLYPGPTDDVHRS